MVVDVTQLVGDDAVVEVVEVMRLMASEAV